MTAANSRIVYISRNLHFFQLWTNVYICSMPPTLYTTFTIFLVFTIYRVSLIRKMDARGVWTVDRRTLIHILFSMLTLVVMRWWLTYRYRRSVLCVCVCACTYFTHFPGTEDTTKCRRRWRMAYGLLYIIEYKSMFDETTRQRRAVHWIRAKSVFLWSISYVYFQAMMRVDEESGWDGPGGVVDVWENHLTNANKKI